MKGYRNKQLRYTRSDSINIDWTLHSYIRVQSPVEQRHEQQGGGRRQNRKLGEKMKKKERKMETSRRSKDMKHVTVHGKTN